MDSFHDELVRQKIIKEHPCKSKRKQYKEINFKIWEDMKEEKERSHKEVRVDQNIMYEFICFLERNEMDIIKDVDTIGFMIQGLKKEGLQYILDDKKEWEEHPDQ